MTEQNSLETQPVRFSTSLPLIVLSRPVGRSDMDWQEVDRGPGYITLPEGHEIRVRIKGINNDEMAQLVNELQEVVMLRFLDLSENRNINNEGMARIKGLPQLTHLNLSSVSVTSTGLEALRGLPHLVYLDLSYCNRLSDLGLKTLESLRNLTYINMQHCLGITKAGYARVRRKNLTIVH